MLVGLLSDTHVPYRAPAIPPVVLEALRGVDLILHAGDVDEPWALAPLRDLAPVHAVRGNYHIVERSNAGASLPKALELEIEGFRVAVQHGHRIGPLALFWKFWALVRNLTGQWDLPGYDIATSRALLRRFPDADVIVFGHTHRFYLKQWGKTLVVNPGAALRTAYFDAPYLPSVAHLLLERGNPPRVERVLLG
ncbi:MAG: metallophosphoesterase family protein [Anaerolineae bacterium]